MAIIEERYAARPETNVYKRLSNGRPSVVNKVLLGTWLGVEQRDSEWLKVRTAGPDGWVKAAETREDCGLKIFFVDVGQGDGALIEVPNQRFLVDGGPNTSLRRYLKGWQYTYLLGNGQQVHFDAAFISHFDADHYQGLIQIIADRSFTFVTIYHNGIARFRSSRQERPTEYDEDLGRTSTGADGAKVLDTTFNDIDDLRQLHQAGGLQATFSDFAEAVFAAEGEGRLQGLQRLTSRDRTLAGLAGELSIEILGPVPTASSGPVRFHWFTDSSHTRNGHSLVLKLTYGEVSVLLGGDLNAESQAHLLRSYENAPNPFVADVAKSCHHGSSDFRVDFMQAVEAQVTVISSGDNESYAHPRADAIGAAGRYGRGQLPLVFSTELARSIRSGEDILYGMIQARSDGRQLILGQMKEKRTGTDIWDSYPVPFVPEHS